MHFPFSFFLFHGHCLCVIAKISQGTDIVLVIASDFCLLSECQPPPPIHLHFSSSSNLRVHIIGQSGVFEFQGLNIAFLSGIYNPHRYDNAIVGQGEGEKYLHYYTPEIIGNFLEQTSRVKDIDVLLTSEWCRGFGNYLHDYEIPKGPKSRDVTLIGSPVLASVIREIRPRYHFCAREDIYYERIPYRNIQRAGSDGYMSDGRHGCRKICLAKVNNTRGQKFLYALNITPIPKMESSDLYQLPERYTECPYQEMDLKIPTKADTPEPQIPQLPSSMDFMGKKRDRPESTPLGELTANTFDELPMEFGSNKIKKKPPPEKQFNPPPKPEKEVSAVRNNQEQQNQNRPRRDAPPPDPRASFCWFCFSSPQVERHLIASIGDEVYVAMAKGGMEKYHCLLVPLQHVEDYHDLSIPAREEMFKYKNALRRFYDSLDQSVIFFERFMVMKGNNHMHTQAVPIPKDLAKHAREAFESEGRDNSISFEDLGPRDSVLDLTHKGEGYFFVELPDHSRLLHRIRGRHPFQFGRQAIARLLGNPGLVDWKSCQLPTELETKITQQFKDAFRPFDFSLE
eukprot:TRINITY_DN8609_c0_g1_i1.p1 TRINITY_DN8609_c0_g1~~TRINITY_DN8609_c0_g1_i1.p1  ORF type:complete len:568 (+),score=91.40 TRINITY_DN8609_c0_g1_i1:520-2223(+)